MTAPLGSTDFFALEAGECLNRLETELSNPEALRPDEFVRLARQFRGAALLAQRQPIARAAAGLEGLARAVRDARRPWDAATRERALDAVERFRALVRQAGAWTADATAACERLGEELEGLAGRSPLPSRTAATHAGEAGIRAFAGREGALIASALERAARSLRAAPAAREPLDAVLRRMQPLRGLAALNELAPLPDLLEGLELALAGPARGGLLPIGFEEVLDAAGAALAQLSREVADGAQPATDAEPLRRFAELLLETFASDEGAVPIAELFAEDDPRPITPPDPLPRPAALGAVELVSHGEHLTQVADALDAARTAIERDLRLFALVAPLARLADGDDAPGTPMRAFALAARAAIGQRRAGPAARAFAAILRRAGGLLRSATEARDGAAVAGAWAQCRDELAALALGRPEPAEPVAGAPAAEPAGAALPDPLATALGRYDELRRTRGTEAPSLEALLAVGEPAARAAEAVAEPVSPESVAAAAAGESLPEPVPIASLAPMGADAEHQLPIVPIASLAPDEPEDVGPEEVTPVVPIGDLLYRGRAALERAERLRADVQRGLASPGGWDKVRPMVEELLDLVPLALDGA